jgi:tRNA pseudouridine32 synthase/23S rRNA pseudouridine746 synthase
MVLQPKVPVLYIDDAVLVVNKPAGLPSLLDGYHPDLPHLRSLLEPAYGRLWVVHRLDKETSGVLVLARSADAHRSLNTQFEVHEVGKLYHALAGSSPVWDEKTIHLRLRVNGDRRHRTIVDGRGGKPADTEVTVLERLGAFTLLQAAPKTGRTHQIRAHLAAVGCALVGDVLYGGSEGLFFSQIKAGFMGGRLGECALLARPGLHAWQLSFTHPASGERLTFNAPYPKDLNGALRQLRRYA